MATLAHGLPSRKFYRNGRINKMKRLALLVTIFSLTVTAFAADEKYLGLPLAPPTQSATQSAIQTRYGVPFIEGPLPLDPGGTASVTVSGTVDRIYLLGMTDQISEQKRTGG